MKKLLAMLMALVLVLSLVACGAAPAAPAATEAPKADAPAEAPKTDDVGEPITLIFSIAAVPTDAHGAAQKVFKEKVEELSGGNITVECYDSGTLYGQDTEHDALKNGDVDIIYSSASAPLTSNCNIHNKRIRLIKWPFTVCITFFSLKRIYSYIIDININKVLCPF